MENHKVWTFDWWLGDGSDEDTWEGSLFSVYSSLSHLRLKLGSIIISRIYSLPKLRFQPNWLINISIAWCWFNHAVSPHIKCYRIIDRNRPFQLIWGIKSYRSLLFFLMSLLNSHKWCWRLFHAFFSTFFLCWE